MPQNTELENTSQPVEDPPLNDELSEDEWNEMTNEERNEYTSLQRAMEQIDSCLDALERKNDTLNAQLRELLEANRAARAEIQNNPKDENQLA